MTKIYEKDTREAPQPKLGDDERRPRPPGSRTFSATEIPDEFTQIIVSMLEHLHRIPADELHENIQALIDIWRRVETHDEN